MSETKKPIGHRAWDMEQKLSDAGVFRNGINDRPASLGAYMTVIDFVKFNEAWDKIKDDFTREEWLDSCEYWHGQNYLAPTFGLLARIVEGKLNSK